MTSIDWYMVACVGASILSVMALREQEMIWGDIANWAQFLVMIVTAIYVSRQVRHIRLQTETSNRIAVQRAASEMQRALLDEGVSDDMLASLGSSKEEVLYHLVCTYYELPFALAAPTDDRIATRDLKGFVFERIIRQSPGLRTFLSKLLVSEGRSPEWHEGLEAHARSVLAAIEKEEHSRST